MSADAVRRVPECYQGAVFTDAGKRIGRLSRDEPTTIEEAR
jgi:hypothetical protein